MGGEEEKEGGFHFMCVICTFDNKNVCAVCLVPTKQEDGKGGREGGRESMPEIDFSC